jgi:lysophospholipase L1-like esterase
MKQFQKLAIVVISIIIIFTCAYVKSVREGLTGSNTIVLLGDSILNNSKYVPEGASVVDNLKTKTNNVFNFAKDGATINDLYTQLDNVTQDLNNSNTYIFISAGGNDILNKGGQLTSSEIKSLFNTYMNFLTALRERLGSVKINILNLYLPANPRYQSYKESIDQWNNLIKEYSFKIGEMYNVVDMYTLLTTPEDFIYDIEPSELASKKIANAIYFVT